MRALYYTLFFILSVASNVFAQSLERPAKFQVLLRDKGDLSEYKNNPSQFLSDAALKRRTLQNIPIQWNDYPLNQNYITAIEAQGFTILNRSKWFNSLTVYCADSAKVDQLQKLNFVSAVRPVTKVLSSSREQQFKAEQQKNEARLKNQVAKPFVKSDRSSNYGMSAAQSDQIQLTNLHGMGFKGQGISIAVLDAGFYNCDRIAYFDSLRIQNRILGTHDFVQGNDSVYEDNSHGMSVLSCMAANVAGEMLGTAPKANYWLFRTEDAGSEYLIEEDNWVAAAEYADSAGAWIINSSLGYTVFDDPQASHSYADMNGNTTRISIGADIAASKGILVVNSAGNSGDNSWQFIGAPADADSVLSIGAVDSLGNYASFSSLGPSADGRLKPNVSAMGQATAIVTSSGALGKANGTSFSSPVIAGAAACLWQAFPDASNMEIFRAIEQSAHRFETPDNQVGFGIPNFTKAFGILMKARNAEAERDSLMNVYPNPASESLTIEFYSASEQTLEVTITKLSGKRVQQFDFKTLPFYTQKIQMERLRKLSSGNYILTIKNEAGKLFSRRVLLEN